MQANARRSRIQRRTGSGAARELRATLPESSRQTSLAQVATRADAGIHGSPYVSARASSANRSKEDPLELRLSKLVSASSCCSIGYLQRVMKLNRREILAGLGAVAAHGAVAPRLQALAAAGFPRKDDFAIPAGTAYLNAAMIHPMPRVAADAVARGMELRVSGATVPSFAGGGAKPLPKVAFAALINAKPSEIAYVPNTSTGENLVVNGLGLDRDLRGNVVTDALHFEGALMHLLELKKKGLDVRIARPTADGRIDMRDMERLVDKQTRLVEVSSVASYNGFQHDLKAVCELAHANGSYVYADI